MKLFKRAMPVTRAGSSTRVSLVGHVARLCLLAAVGAAACSKSSFSGTKTSAPPATAPTKLGPPVAVTGSPEPQGEQNQIAALPKEAVFDLSCDAELAGSALAVKATAGVPGHFVDVSPTCSSVRSSTATKAVAEAVDIIFVLDVTASMGGNISSVRTNIQKFVDKLISRGWDARFAAIAFRDTGDSTVPGLIPFGAAAQISSRLNSWPASGGDDVQEGSQDAVAAAVKLFQDSGRPAARKVVLLVSDEVGYAVATPGVAEQSHRDFSVTTLASRLKFAGVGNLRLFCSVRDSSGAYGLTVTRPTTQCDDIRAQAGIEGENLGFPLSESVLLEQFITKFQVVNASEELTCRLQGAQLAGNPAEKLPSGSQRIALGAEADVAAAVGKVIEVKRCCSVTSGGVGAVLEAAICSDPVVRKVTLELAK